ncbi:hypothetical protein P5673_009942 [Acropora cervicornis]|uniref:Uncharacterized protein n=1 Tax=Acropora cervicornis TaxID=6130 RepID=A0AAD9QS25_ACRCE|nr:hypothetical protein P5673_009942 [Acropora cervicornis]
MSSAASERFNPALEAPSGSTNDENISVELPSLNQDRHGHSENETGKEPWNADLLEKRTTQVFKVLQLLGLVTGGRSRRLANLFMLLIALIVWIPPMSLSVCVAKDPIMSSPSGLPTILLFSGLALSHHFGALYGKRHRELLRKNVYLAIERANFCRTCVMMFALFGILTVLYLVLLVYLYVRQSILPVPWLQICVIYFLGYIYCASASVAMNLIFSSVCSAIKIRINDFRREFKSWSDGLREALNKYQDLVDFMDREVEAIKCFIVIWFINFHLWQIVVSDAGRTDVVRLVFYNCSWTEPLPAPKLSLPDGFIIGCEMLFSSLVFFFFMSPLIWAATVTVQCHRFRDWVNCTRLQSDDRPLGQFNITSLDFFINRVQMANYFAFRLPLLGVNVTKERIFLTGLMTTLQFILSIVAKQALTP